MARLRELRARGDRGAVATEYAVATVAACGIGGILVNLLSGEKVQSMLWNAIRGAFSAVLG